MNNIKQTGAGIFKVGKQCNIGENVDVTFVSPATVEIGDYVSLGDNVKMIIDGGNVTIGDWTTLHSDVLVLSKTGVDIGAHCWFGQNTVLDGTGGLQIGNGVRIGMYSQIWSHVAAGEQIEGCTLYGEGPVHIDSDVWLVGSCMVASNVKIGRRTVALSGSNITKSHGSNVVLAGSPARTKEGLSFYREIDIDEKFSMLDGWITEFASASIDTAPLLERAINYVCLDWAADGVVKFFKFASDYNREKKLRSANMTLCCLETKQYTKTLSNGERRTLKYLAGNKARFYVDPN